MSFGKSEIGEETQSTMQAFFKTYPVASAFKAVTCGRYNEMQLMLEEDKEFIADRAGIVRDLSGRLFYSISDFEYTLWALDKHMWTLMLDSVETLPDEERIPLARELYQQYQRVKQEGVSYQLNGKIITEHHFDFGDIIKELQTQIDSQWAEGKKDQSAIDKQWKEGVGGAQKRFPMHVVYEWCSKVPFFPVPDFSIQPAVLCRQFRNYTAWKPALEDWFDVASKLGVDFAMMKGMRGRPPEEREVVADQICCRVEIALIDLDAMIALHRIRSRDFIDLGARLEKLMQADFQPTMVLCS